MLINDLGWRGVVAVQCGFVDIVLRREAMKSLLERESFSPNKSIACVWLEHGTGLDLRA